MAKVKKRGVRNIVVISDQHFGSRLGLCPSWVKLDDGGIYRSSKNQKIVFSWWDEFWTNWVPRVTKHEEFYVVDNGDALDGVPHGSVAEISNNIEDQVRIAKDVLSEVLRLPKCAGYFHIRGTEAHVGKSGQYEEMLARELGAIPDENGNHARWDLWLEMSGGVLVHFTHHVGVTQSAQYESTAVLKELVEAYNEAGRQRERAPDVVVRSHRHRSIKIEVPTSRGYGIVFTTAAWQLNTPYSWRFALGRAGTPQIGGHLIRHGDEDWVYTRSKIWHIERSPVVKL